MTFEEWYKTKDKEEFCSYSAQEGFKAGQEAMKAERDYFKNRIDSGIRALVATEQGDWMVEINETGFSNSVIILDEGIEL